MPRELTKVQNVAIAIPESTSEPLSLGCNADRQLARSLSAHQQWLFSAARPCCVKLKCVCELEDVPFVNMSENSDGTSVKVWLLFALSVKAPCL